MIEPKLFTATFDGKEHTLSAKDFSKLIGRSLSFVSARMMSARSEGIDEVMQYAVDESLRLLAAGKVKIVDRSTSRMSPVDSKRMKKEERFKDGIKSVMDRFLYPSSVEVIGKREYSHLSN